MTVVSRAASSLSAKQIRSDLGLSRDKMGRIMGVTSKAIEGWEKEDRLPANEGRRAMFAQLAEIRTLGLTVFTPDGFTQFLNTPLPTFEHRTALKELEFGHFDRVLGVLAGIYEGTGH